MVELSAAAAIPAGDAMRAENASSLGARIVTFLAWDSVWVRTGKRERNEVRLERLGLDANCSFKLWASEMAERVRSSGMESLKEIMMNKMGSIYDGGKRLIFNCSEGNEDEEGW